MDIRFPNSLPRLAAALARRRMPNPFALSQIQPKAKASVSWKTSSSGIMEFRAMRNLIGRSRNSTRRLGRWKGRQDERTGSLHVLPRGEGSRAAAWAEDGPGESGRICRHAAGAGAGKSKYSHGDERLARVGKTGAVRRQAAGSDCRVGDRRAESGGNLGRAGIGGQARL